VSVGVDGRSPHPLLGVLERAAAGVFPAVDGVVEVLPADHDGGWAIVEFTGHAFVLTDRAADEALFADVDAFGGVTHPRFVVELAGQDAVIGSHDLVVVRRGGGSSAPRLEASDVHDDHPRVERARHHRHDVRVLGDERGLVTIGTGLAGRVELSVEVVSGRHGAGAGRALVLGALADIGSDTFVFAQVAAGNAASLRALLACGFRPIGSEILIDVGPHTG